MSLRAISYNCNFYQTLSNAYSDALETGRRIEKYICTTFSNHLGFISSKKIINRVNIVPERNSTILKVVRKVATVAGWGTLIAQVALGGFLGLPSLIKSDRVCFSIGLIGFPVSACTDIYSSFKNYRGAWKINDKQDLDYKIGDLVLNIFSLLGGIFFVLTKFTVKQGISFAFSTATIAFYSVSYLIDIGKNSYQAQKCMKFKDQIRAIIADSGLNNPESLKRGLNFLINQVTATDYEKAFIAAELNLNPELKGNVSLKNKIYNAKIKRLSAVKYKRFERMLGKEAANYFLSNIDRIVKSCNSSSPVTEVADLLEKVCKGISTQITQHVKQIIIELCSLLVFTLPALLSSGMLVPVLVFIAPSVFLI